MTKTVLISRSDRLSQVQSRFRRISAEMFCDPNNSGHSDSDNDSDFQIHRKMLRRRHVRKEQKERDRRRKELEELERSWRKSREEKNSNATIIDTFVQAGCPPHTHERDRTMIQASPHNRTLFSVSPLPPQTESFQLMSSIDQKHVEKKTSDGTIVPPFSPLRSRKLRRRLF